MAQPQFSQACSTSLQQEEGKPVVYAKNNELQRVTQRVPLKDHLIAGASFQLLALRTEQVARASIRDLKKLEYLIPGQHAKPDRLSGDQALQTDFSDFQEPNSEVAGFGEEALYGKHAETRGFSGGYENRSHSSAESG